MPDACPARRPHVSYRVKRRGRRWWLAAATVATLLSLFALPVVSQPRPRLLVYLQSSIRPHALESSLARQMPLVDVVVVGRYRDFARELGKNPDAALALQPVLTAHGLSIELQGTRAGSETEGYVLLSISSGLSREEFPGLVVGAVDLLGRERMTKFVATLLGLPKSPEIKYVIKSDDLLPLLQFQSARAVILSEPDAVRIQALSKLDLKTTPLATRVGLAAASFRTDAGRRVVKASLQALDAESRRKLGVEAWQ